MKQGTKIMEEKQDKGGVSSSITGSGSYRLIPKQDQNSAKTIFEKENNNNGEKVSSQI